MYVSSMDKGILKEIHDKAEERIGKLLALLFLITKGFLYDLNRKMGKGPTHTAQILT